MSLPLSPSNLTVGEVARRSGLTVRTLHHYDTIGLLQPSARSASGYRLYSPRDVERLHQVQSLKQLGFGLDAIAGLLSDGSVAAGELLARQIAEAERTISDTQALRYRLLLLRDAISQGRATSEDLLEAVRLVATYQQHLPGQDVRRLLARWRGARARWAPIADRLSALQAQDTPVDDPQVQHLAQRWMNVAMNVFGGRLHTVLQWARMHAEQPDTATHAGLDAGLLGYLEQAIDARLRALRRHLSDEDLACLDGSLGPEWERLAQEGQALLDAQAPPHGEAARALRDAYHRLLARTVRHDQALAQRMRTAHEREPILAHGHFVTPALRAYLASIPLDPDVT